MTLIWPTRLGPGLRRFCRPRARAGDLALPTFVPSSTPSFTFCGQAADRLPMATIATRISTLGHGLPLLSGLAKCRCVGSSTPRALRAGPSRCGPSGLSFGGHYGWRIGQDHRAWWYAWIRRVQASKGPQTSYPSRHPWTTARQPCRTGRHIRSARVCSAAWRTACVVSEDPDGHSRCRSPKP